MMRTARRASRLVALLAAVSFSGCLSVEPPPDLSAAPIGFDRADTPWPGGLVTAAI